MDNRRTNYSPTRKANAKPALLALLFAVVALTVTAMMAAFYSDIFEDRGEATSGSLKFDASYSITLNGEPTTLQSMRKLNPGDVVVVAGSIQNIGSQSAWVRERIEFSQAQAAILPYLTVYNTALTQQDFAGGDVAQHLMTQADDGVFVSGNRVINGTDETITEGSYTLIGAANYSFSYTIYFSTAAPNATQSNSFTILVATQGLQYANNNTAEPDENAWAVVTAA